MATIGEKKHHHIGLWITLILIFVIVILPVGLTFAFFFDPSHTTSEQIGVDTSKKGSNLADNLVVDLFDYTADESMDNSLSIKIDEKEINQSLYDNFLSTLDSNTSTVIPQAYLEIGQEEYTFVVEVNAYGFFKTRLFIVTSLEISDNPQGLKFKLKDLKIARLGGMQTIALSILKNFIDDAKITSALQSSLPLKIESHLFDNANERYLFYPHDSFVSDINSMIKLGNESAFFKDFLIDMISKREFKFDFYKNKGIQGLLSLQQFHNNDAYCSYNDYVIDFEGKKVINQYLPTLLKNGNVNENNIDLMGKFLTYGYTQLNSTEKTLIDNASYLPSVLGKSVSEYSEEREAKYASKGKPLSEVETIDSIVTKQVGDALTPARAIEIKNNDGGKIVDAKISEIDLHDSLKTNSIIGYGKVFFRPTDDGSYKVSFISVDNLYVNITKNNLYFIVGININGYEVTMALPSIFGSAGNGKINFTLDSDNAYFGNYKIQSSLFNSFTTLLDNSFNDESWITYDGRYKRFTLDFSKAVNEVAEIKYLKQNGLDIDISISANGNTISDNGYLNIGVNASRS